MPHSLQWSAAVQVTDHMRYLASRPLDHEDRIQAEKWVGDQIFTGRVIQDVTMVLQGYWYVAGYFDDPRDLLLFKLAWG